ncbi:type 1 fimbrial protein [Burkholderia pyrrocinia]|uniref:fimbrial protein n=1 Tax=Burkholderia pyrrocinia TaxID=60550 RepID=UPI001FB1FB6A|nr:fimbrial protein [Burkholderia pyrrocinia]UOB59418.1 type 1 fimbrial protein [Burkholderia pyrrocinia]
MKMLNLRWTPNRNRQTRSRAMRMLAPCLLLLAAFGAHAECNVISQTPVYGMVPLSGTINVPRDVAVGTELGKMVMTLAERLDYASCSTAGTMVLDRKLSSTPHLPPTSDKVYPTNLPGVGVKFLYGSSTDPFPYQSSITVKAGSVWGMGAGTTFTYVFVATGPVSGGTIEATDLPTASFELRGNAYLTVQAIGSLNFAALSCKTPDVTVDMGTVRAADMKSVGATSNPVSFKVAANNCPAGISKITYQFKAPNGVLDAAAGVVALSDDSTARGFALKLMDENGAALRFDSPYPINVAPTGGSYALPMKAAYYRTSQTISSGSANAILTFTMSYN